MSQGELKKVFVASDDTEAMIVKTRLESVGIPCILKSMSALSILTSSSGPQEIYVAAKDEEAATRELAEDQQNP